MDTPLLLIVTIIVLAAVYAALRSGKRLGRQATEPEAASYLREHGDDLQARRKLYDDVT
ncbi:MAG TPA: hypothetical protein VEI95_00885 [Acidobacteriota bacterium]|nr:hypothetical protein [Acidobacteriota bacterium]